MAAQLVVPPVVLAALFVMCLLEEGAMVKMALQLVVARALVAAVVLMCLLEKRAMVDLEVVAQGVGADEAAFIYSSNE